MKLGIGENKQDIVWAATDELLWELYGVKSELEVSDDDFYEMGNVYRLAKIENGALAPLGISHEREKLGKERRMGQIEQELEGIDAATGMGRAGRKLLLDAAVRDKVNTEDYKRLKKQEDDADKLREEWNEIKESL